MMRPLLLSVFLLIGLISVNAQSSSQLSVTLESPSTNIYLNPFKTSTVIYRNDASVQLLGYHTQNQYIQVQLPNRQLGWVLLDDVVVSQRPNISEHSNPDFHFLTSMTSESTSLNPYIYDGQEQYIYPRAPKNKAMNLSVDGFYEVKLSGRSFSPKRATGNTYQKIINDSTYTKIPKNVLVGQLKPDLRADINIDGSLDNDLTVHLDIEQEPDFPIQADVQVGYKGSKLSFGDYDAEFSTGEFLRVKKSLNGVKAETQRSKWKGQFAYGVERSDPKVSQGFGTGQETYQMGSNYILEGSVRVWINNALKNEGSDYTVNYFKGEIKFANPPQKTDFYKIAYEHSNPIADFLPVISRKNFMGISYSDRQYQEEVKVAKQVAHTQSLWPPLLDPTMPTQNQNISLSGPASLDLDHPFIVLGSEIVKQNGFVLDHTYDYYIKHDEGVLVFLGRLNPTDTLSISYEHYPILTDSVDIIGSNITGPYSLGVPFVVSEKITLDGRPVTKDRDYQIDYDQGLITFEYPISYPQIISASIRHKDFELTSSNVTTDRFSINTTYIKEFARSDEEQMTVSVTDESIIDLNKTLSTNRFKTRFSPLVNTANLQIKINNTVLTTANYQIINDYNGDIQLNAPFSVTDPIVVSYDYRRHYKTSFTFKGLSGKQGSAYNLTEDLPSIPNDLPMTFNTFYEPTSYISIWNGQEELFLEPDVDYIVDYGVDGQTILLTFLIKSQSTDGKLSRYPNETDVITLHYDFTPSQSNDLGNIEQKMIGANINTQLSPNWSVNTEIVGTNHNLSKPQVSTSTEFNGNGEANYFYPLNKTNIVKGSDTVFVNDQLINENTDYYLNTVKGTIKFRNLTPQSTDTIRVIFDYYDTQGQTQSGNFQGYKFAAKVNTKYETDTVKVGSHYKFVDDQFFPIGQTLESPGSRNLGGSISLTPKKNVNLSMSYDRRQSNKGDIGESKKRYLTQDDIKSNASYSLLNFFKVNHIFELSKQIEDPQENAPLNNRHGTDIKSHKFGHKVSFGPSHLNMSIQQDQSKRMSDFLDQQNSQLDQTTSYEYKLKWALKPKPWMYRFKIDPRYRIGQSSKSTQQSPDQLSYSTRETYEISSEVSPLKQITNQLGLTYSRIASKEPNNPSENVNLVKNYYSKSSFKPSSWFNSRYQFTHNESESPLINQKGSVHTRNNVYIDRFSLYGMLARLGVPHAAFFMIPIEKSNARWENLVSDKYINNNQKFTGNTGEKVSIQNISPIPKLTLKSYSFGKSHTLNVNDIPSSTSSSNRTTHIKNRQDASISFSPQMRWLKKFKWSYKFEKRDDETRSITNANTVTQNHVITQKPYFKRSQSLSFHPGIIRLPLPFKHPFTLGQTSINVTETLSDIREEITTNYYAPQSNQLANSIFQVDSKKKQSMSATSKMTPFNLISTTARISSQNEFLKRNRISTGSTFKDIKSGSLKSQYSPFRFLGLSGNYSVNRVNQYQSNSVSGNVEPVTLINMLKNNDFSDAGLSKYLYKRSDKTTLTATIKPFRRLSISGSGFYQEIKQFIQNPAVQQVTYYQQSANSKLTLTPIPKLAISGGYSLSFTSATNSPGKKQGYKSTLEANYDVSKTKNRSIKLTYNRVENWGVGFNQLAQESSEQATGDIIETEILTNKNVVETGSIVVNIIFPVDTSPFIDRFVIQGEGYLKKISDALDGNNNYSISGLLLTGKIEF